MAAMNSGTPHCSKASYRRCRRAMILCGRQDVVDHCMYSRSHCFAIIPKSAEARLRTRLTNHRQLIHNDAEVGENGSTFAGGEGRELFDNSAKICTTASAVVWELSGWRVANDKTMNAERTAEKRPACGLCSDHTQSNRSKRVFTHEDQEGVDVIVEAIDDVLVVA